MNASGVKDRAFANSSRRLKHLGDSLPKRGNNQCEVSQALHQITLTSAVQLTLTRMCPLSARKWKQRSCMFVLWAK